MSFAETIINTLLDRKLAQPATSVRVYHSAERSLAKGVLAGLVAGLAATAAKSVVEKVYPPQPEGRFEPTAAESINLVAGAAIGAAYGAIAEYYPAAASRDGVNFGMTLMALTHESTLPALGPATTPAGKSGRETSSEIASLLVFGLVAETTRRLVRKML